jgi:hypothetical protein
MGQIGGATDTVRASGNAAASSSARPSPKGLARRRSADRRSALAAPKCEGSRHPLRGSRPSACAGRRTGTGRSSERASRAAPGLLCPSGGEAGQDRMARRRDVHFFSDVQTEAIATRLSASARRPSSKRPCRPQYGGPRRGPCPGRLAPPWRSARRRRSRRRSSCRTG